MSLHLARASIVSLLDFGNCAWSVAVVSLVLPWAGIMTLLWDWCRHRHAVDWLFSLDNRDTGTITVVSLMLSGASIVTLLGSWSCHGHALNNFTAFDDGDTRTITIVTLHLAGARIVW